MWNSSPSPKYGRRSAGHGGIALKLEAPQELDGGKGVRVTAEPKLLAFTVDTCASFSPERRPESGRRAPSRNASAFSNAHRQPLCHPILLTKGAPPKKL